ncbi:50S ribosomal protein L4 [Malacoplasma penetrans]|uniref:Large ribosomal subunit protein uL4 n=1 Tax=Malacoplasma penetrans (strain HF-2) TaxID=272633 RepID=RL4_MALP2|nr:50S ribosomal protein L4 [Malacoplasma penetrans]Q8EUB4.1 RecName: Full=Large ribosomal subunit protein uL4; AltName: Full=50S ribosomal protein L4 [Malacoplasma penetrans HF-2]RXY96855.1 50S ribosomal protein L4 [Malacoplasma penetrans]BAC44802.1 ribosomal protein L4 [Malacoplasma penetrans HF-2]
MSSVKLFKDLLGNTETVELKNKKLFISDKKINHQEIFNSVLVEEANSRQSTASTLTKAEVRGGGRKPYKQKHTGRARQGSIRNPHYVGGGRAFGPSPEKNYTLKQNSKAYKLAFQSAMTLKLNEQGLNLLVNKIDMKEPSTKTISKMLKKVSYENKKVLFVINDKNENFLKSCKNIQKVTSKMWNQVSVRDILNSDIAVIQEDAFDKISEVFA